MKSFFQELLSDSGAVSSTRFLILICGFTGLVMVVLGSVMENTLMASNGLALIGIAVGGKVVNSFGGKKNE